MKQSDIRDPSVHDRYLELVKADTHLYFDDPDSLENVDCPACGRQNSVPQFEKFGFTYAQCLDCRSLYVNPRPTLEQLEGFYVNSESSRFWVEKFFKPVLESRRSKIFRPRAEFVADLVGVEDFVVGDIGAGFGLFLEELRSLKPGASCIAIEPSPEMASICRGLNLEVVETIIERVPESVGSFDILCSFELFEHLQNPRSMIEAAYSLLKPGGRLLITTLNGEGFDIQLLWSESKSVFPPHHLNFCNPDSISLLLQDVGFEIEKAETPGALDWDIVETGISRDGVKLDRFWDHLASHCSDECKAEFQSWLSANNLSSHMRILARKP